VERILRVYLDLRLDGESFVETVRRIGVHPFRERVYEDHQFREHVYEGYQEKADNKERSVAI
jgi:hypothetical protein